MEQKIYVNFPIPSTVGEFIPFLYSHQGGVVTAIATYEDEECTIEQSKNDAWRSFDDLIIIINTYYPGTTEKELIHELICADIKGAKYQCYPYLVLCSAIKKCTISYYAFTRGDGTFLEGRGNSKCSWGELLLLLGITNDKELKEYIKANKKSS